MIVPVVEDNKWVLIEDPPPNKWEFRITPGSMLVFCLPTGPNAFHRWMQKVAFGFEWKPKS